MMIEKLTVLEERLSQIEYLLEASLGLNKTTPSTGKLPLGNEPPLGTITRDMMVENYSSDKLSLLHTMLHLFHKSKTGKNLNNKDIQYLHSKVKEKLQTHVVFDDLDSEIV